MVGVFSYITYHLAAAPFGLSPDRLSLLFLVYLLATVVTPAAGRLFAAYGYSRSLRCASLVGFAGILLTLNMYLPVALLGLGPVRRLGLCQPMIPCLSGYVSALAGEQRSLGLGLYLSAYYLVGARPASCPPGLMLLVGRTACAALFGAVYLTLATAVAARLRP